MTKGTNISIGCIQATKSRYEKSGYVWWKSGKPLVLQVAYGHQIGKKENAIFVWSACPTCKFERWVKGIKNYGRKCAACVGREYGASHTGALSSGWRGGKSIVDGYVSMLLSKDSLYLPMAIKYKQKGYTGYRIAEHRLVMAQCIGRLLQSWEIVHHINGNKQDNRIENLELLPGASEHIGYTAMQKRIKSLENRVTVLESENILLESQVDEFKSDNTGGGI